MKRLLIIEDDPAILRGLEAALAEEHYELSTVADGERGFANARETPFDLIILDLMLPGKNGMEICRDLRAQGVQTPILMLTSKKEETDKVLGLEMGADDYVTKPFSIRELKARISAILRRQDRTAAPSDHITFGVMEVDFKKQEATMKGQAVILSAREFAILRYFIQHEGEVVTRDMLLDSVWGYDHFPTTRTVDNYILSLRKKIEEDPSSPKHLCTVHTAGYKFHRTPPA
jgi:DNA-binding response OmpR family regulator